MTSALKVLVSVRELLSDEKRWTRRWYARDAAGVGVGSRDKHAVCWCLVGAMRKSPIGKLHQEVGLDLLRSVVYGPIAGFNDDPKTTHADVLRVLDAAIERAKQDG